jgi:hypothetical protein
LEVVEVREARRSEVVFVGGKAGEGEVLRKEGHILAVYELIHSEDGVVRV